MLPPDDRRPPVKPQPKTILRRTAVQPTVNRANDQRAAQTVNRIIRSNPQAAKVVAQGVQKAAQAQHPNVVDHVLKDTTPGQIANEVLKAKGSPFHGGIAQSVGKEIANLGLKQEQMRGKQPQGLAEAGKQLLAIHQRADQQQAGSGGDQLVSGLGKAAVATVEHPGKVGMATLKSIPGAVEGLVAGPVELLDNPAGTLKGIRQDYSRRYGKDAGKAVQQEGLLPYALDVGTAGAALGRLAGAAAEARGSEIMAERPNLRVSPERAVPQTRSKNIIKAVGENIADKSRTKATLKRQNQGTPRGIEPGPNEVVPRSKYVANKKLEQSFGVRSNVNRNLHVQGRQEIRQVFEKQIPKTLTKDQINHGALRYALEHGIRTPEQATTFLPKLKSLITENRTHAPIHDELPHIQWLIDHPNVFNKPLGDVADTVREMGKRLGAEDPRLKLKQQRERTATPQGILLGHGPRLKNERVKAYEARVAEARQAAGLAEPGYFHHTDLLKPKFADWVRGTGVHGAIGGHKQTDYTLMKEGAAVVHPQALGDALARNLKNQFNVNHVANTVAGFAVRKLVNKDTGAPIHLDPVKSTYHDLQRAKEESGVTDLVAYRPNTIHKAFRDSQADPKNPIQFLSDAYTTAKDPSAFHNSKGWVLIPKEIDKQMRDSLKHNSAFSRMLAKNKSFNTKTILGLNPSWPVMRVGHNLGSSAIFGVNPLKAVEAAKNLTPEQSKALNSWVGADAFHFDKSPPRLGGSIAPTSKLAALREIALSDTKTGKAIRAANPGTWVDQLSRPAMAAERHQMAFFRRAAAYQKLSKDAKAKVNADVTGLIDTASKARDELLKNPQYMEALAHHVNEIFGDFTHYQGIQRTLQQNVMFYGFLRYATRVVLKDLPMKHPLKANILLNLSRQNERNTRDLLGLGPNDPLPFGADANVYSRDKNGQLSAMNLHRLNPFGAASLENVDNPRRTIIGSLPYAETEAATQFLNADLLRMHGVRVDGKAAEKGIGDSVSLPDHLRIALADFLKQAAPYRIADNSIAAGRKMGNDSLAFSPRPLVHKQTQAIANDLLAQKFGEKQGLLGQILKAEAPFVKQPSRDDTIALQTKQQLERLAGTHLTPQQKAAEQKKLRAQPGYAEAFARAQVLSRQRSKHRGRRSTGAFSVDNAIGGGTNVIDSILP